MSNSKAIEQIVFLYNWMRIARKPYQSLRDDIKLLFQLINISISDCQVHVIQKTINPNRNKTQLAQQDLISCLIVEEQCKKPKQKQLINAFKCLASDKGEISFEELQQHLLAESIDSVTCELILKQLAVYANENSKFDFHKFANSIY